MVTRVLSEVLEGNRLDKGLHRDLCAESSEEPEQVGVLGGWARVEESFREEILSSVL